jgi:inner membrane protein
MPSPLAHLAAGYAVYAISQTRQPEHERSRKRSVPFLLLVAAGFSILPDVDSVVGLLSGDFGRFHNNLTHSLPVGVVAALLFGGLMRWRRGHGFWFWFAVTLIAHDLHVVMDWATTGRGVMAWWPFSETRFQAPIIVFYGLHWSQGWLSLRHVWTLVTELAFVAVTWAALRSLAAWQAKRPA